MTTLLPADVDATRRATRDRLTALFASGVTGNALARQINLSARQLEVLQMSAQGLSNGEIGAKLFMSEDTVKTHRRRASLALGARNGTHAVAIAYKLGILQAFVRRCPACGWAPGQRTNGGAS